MSSHPNHQPQKRARKSEAEEEEGADRISALPDELIERILSLLPSTKDTIRTAFLSKRWRYLWTHFPDLFFCASEFIDCEQFVHFVNSALRFRTSFGIQKFVIDFDPRPVPEEWYPQITDWLRYATTNNVKELTLDIDPVGTSYSLPQFLYSNDSLIELNISACDIMPKGKIDWTKLKILSIVGSCLSEDVVEIILSGSPVLESLELHVCDVINHLNITTPSLKRLVLDIISVSGESFFLEISAPNVEDLEILGEWSAEVESSIDLPSIDVPSLISCKLDFHLHVWPGGMPDGNDGNIVQRLVEMVRHAKKLKVGRLLLKALSELGVECRPSQPLESKVFVLCLPDFCEDYFVGIASLLCSLNKPEKLVIEFSYRRYNGQSPSIYESGDNYWELMSQKQDFSSLLSHLKTIEIFGLGACYELSHKALPLVEFLIKNGKVLEKAIIYDADSFTKQNLLKMTEKLLGFQRCSRAVILFPK